MTMQTSQEVSDIADLLVMEGLDDGNLNIDRRRKNGNSGDDVMEGVVDAALEVHRAAFGDDESSQYRGNGEEERAYADQYDWEYIDDSSPQTSGAQPVPPRSTQFNTPQEAAYAVNWLQGQAQELQQALRSHVINEHQFAQGMGIVQDYAREIQEGMLSLREKQIFTHQSMENYHSALSSVIPEWGDPANRQALVNRYTNFLANKGFPPELLNTLPHPAVAKFVYDEIRKDEAAAQKQAQKRAKAKQTRHQNQLNDKARQQYGHPADQVNAIANLLAHVGAV